MFTCNADQNSSRHHTSNSAWDTNQAVPWPRVLGSLMTSTSFGLNGAVVSTEDRAFWSICWAGGEHGSGWETCCKDLWWAELLLEIATGSMFQVSPPPFFFFLVFSKVIFSSFSAPYVPPPIAQRWSGSRPLTSNHVLGWCRFKWSSGPNTYSMLHMYVGWSWQCCKIMPMLF